MSICTVALRVVNESFGERTRGPAPLIYASRAVSTAEQRRPGRALDYAFAVLFDPALWCRRRLGLRWCSPLSGGVGKSVGWGWGCV